MSVKAIRFECSRAICLLSLGCLLAIVAGSFAPATAQTPSDFVSWLQSLPPDAQSLPLRRFRYHYEQRAFPNQTIPPGAMARARQEHEQRFGPLREQQAPGAPPPFNQTQWTSIGPKLIPLAQLDPRNTPASGRIRAMAIDPNNANTIYVGAASGGVWKTEDGGTTWRALTDPQCSLVIGSIAIDPTNTKVIYAGTGEGPTLSSSFLYGCGVLKSTDGGVSWTQMGASVFAPANRDGARIWKIAIGGNTLMVASDFGLFRSTDGGTSFQPMVLQPGTAGGVATDVIIDPSNPRIIYAAIGNIFGSGGVGVPANGFYQSDTGGDSWLPGPPPGFPTANVGRIALALAPSSTPQRRTLYAAVHNTSDRSLLGVFVSYVGGGAWSRLAATGANCAPQCEYDMYLAVDPTNENTVYFGGISLFKSTTGGRSFDDIGGTIHVDNHAFAFAPGDPTTIYAGNDGGLFVKRGDAAFQSLNDGLVITQFYPGLALNGSAALGGTQDNGTNLTGNAQGQSPSNWIEVIGADGGFAAIDGSTQPRSGYGEFQWSTDDRFRPNNGPRKSTNPGTTPFTAANNGIDTNDPAQFIPPLAMSPSTSSTLYFGTKFLYKTTDGAGNWNTMPPRPNGVDLTGGGCDFDSSSCIRTIAEAKSNGQVVYVGTGSGRVQVTTDGGASWKRIDKAPLPLRAITYVAVDPTNSDNVFVTVSGFGAPGIDGHVFKSTNGTAGAGTTWTDISGTMPSRLPNIPVNAIVLDPTAPTTEILVGTDLGVYRTRDGGVTWNPYNAGLPNAPVLDLVLNQGLLAAATYGRGVWTAQFGAVRATHDFNGDRLSDILWRHNSGGVAMWMMRAGSILSAAGVGSLDPIIWGVVGTFDQNGDGFSDILWHNTSGGVLLWLMNGPNLKKAVGVGSLPTNFGINGVGDFNGDGIGDILWRDRNGGDVAIWFLNSSSAIQSSVGVANLPGNWAIAGLGDFNADGIRDILWRETTQGGIVIWLMNNNGTIKSAISLGSLPPAQWNITGVGDFDGDGVSDILWRGLVDGSIAMWLMNNNGTIKSGIGLGTLSIADWTIEQTGDFNSDGKSDILWRHSSGGVAVWLMDGGTLKSALGIGLLTNDWQIQGVNAD